MLTHNKYTNRMKAPPPPTTTSSLLMDVGRLLRADFRRRAEHLKLTQSQVSPLASLPNHPAISQFLLAAHLEAHTVTASPLIDHLLFSALANHEVHKVHI